ncbi:hypothetical protein [Pseudonocardia sp.]|nr:hypothetical protein [Pseudonocardia sp.]
MELTDDGGGLQHEISIKLAGNGHQYGRSRHMAEMIPSNPPPLR